MPVTAEFTAMMNRAWNAIDAGLLKAGEAAQDVLQKVMDENVYSYAASPYAMYKRRKEAGGLKDKGNIIATVIDVGTAGRTHELQVEDFAGLQDWGPSIRSAGAAERLDQIIETGDPSYRQPGPRPFYKDAEKQLVDGGIVEGEIAGALMDAGFEVL